MTMPTEKVPAMENPQDRSPWSPPGTAGWVGAPTPPAAPPAPPAGGRRGPGWGGTVTAAVLAALLAAGGTAAAVTALDEDPPPAATSSGDSGRAPTPQVPLDAETVDWTAVAAAVEPSVVSIEVRGRGGGGEGSGVVFDDAGHVLTNNHVVAGAGTGGAVTVAVSDGRVFEAEIVGTDPSTDLAVLRVVDAPDDLTPVRLGDSDEVRVGQPVMALGNPLGLSNTVTTGIVSALDRPVTTQAPGSSPFEPGVPVVTNAIQTDAAVNPGNSGGALVDAQGQLVGINSAIATLGASGGTQAGSIGLGFAIPVNQARWVAESLIETGTVDHAYLGVSLEDAVVTVDGAQREAAGIAEVVAGTPAADAGLSPGDAVVAVDGDPIAGAESLVAQVREREPGSTVTLTVARDGSTRDVQVEFGVRPNG
ncbi:MAG: S1C family serine protease [Actinomycetota bacterium]